MHRLILFVLEFRQLNVYNEILSMSKAYLKLLHELKQVL